MNGAFAICQADHSSLLTNLARNGLVLVALLGLAACNAASAERHGAMAHAQPSTDPMVLRRLAQPFDPAVHTDFWGRPPGWTTLDLDRAPQPPFEIANPIEALRLNALLPSAEADLGVARPFYLAARGPERARAVQCLAEAVYYEAALEPAAGQQAVAQTVLNRLRHPAFPKSVCGVVYQGASQAGCQYSFACDGSRDRPPIQPYWDRAKEVAEAALSGFVDRDVGPATHYHANYVYPRWGPQMVKIVQEGSQIFYRYPGPFGGVEILTGRYVGGELAVSTAGPSLKALAPPPPEPPTVLAPAFPAAGAPPVAGQTLYGRRIPTKQEIAAINAHLAALDPQTSSSRPERSQERVEPGPSRSILDATSPRP
jgi:spore germination cell wall hydrolase CwlJ-like protein